MLSGYEEFLRIKNIINIDEYEKITSFEKDNFELIRFLKDIKSVSWNNFNKKNVIRNYSMKFLKAN